MGNLERSTLRFVVVVVGSLGLMGCTLDMRTWRSPSLAVVKASPDLEITGPAITAGTTATNFVFTVNYTDAAAITLADVDIVLGGTDSAGCVAVVTGAGLTTRTVTVSGCTGDGTVTISIVANSATDTLGNQALAYGPSSAATLRNAFIVRFDTTRLSAGSSANNQVALPLTAWVVYNFTADWGDGQSDTITLGSDPEATHTYASAGTYDIKLKGDVPLFQFYGSGDKLKILDVKQWGTTVWWSMEMMFAGCENLQMSAVDAPDLSGVTNLTGMFSGALIFNGAIGHWDTSNVTDMQSLFGGAKAFNQPIGNWDMSNVQDMRSMLGGAEVFNQDISAWDTSSATDMSGMFFEAKAFNQPINSSAGHWNTSNVTSMGGMFMDAFAFNQDIKDWNTSCLTNMDSMFMNAIAFDKDFSSWTIPNTVSNTTYDDGATGWAPGHKPTFLP
jgi:surface protein